MSQLFETMYKIATFSLCHMLQGNRFQRKANEVSKILSTLRMEMNFVLLDNSQTSQALE